MTFFLFITWLFAVGLGFLLVLYLGYALLVFLIPIFFGGAVFAQTQQSSIHKIITLANPKPGQKAVDVGSGDGRLVIALAKSGVQAHGYEINPWLVLVSRLNIKKAGMKGRAFVHWRNFWNEDFSDFDIVMVYGISYIMGRLQQKLKRELKPGARIISNYFIFSDWQPRQQEGNFYLYVK